MILALKFLSIDYLNSLPLQSSLESHLTTTSQILSLKNRLRDMREAMQAKWPERPELLTNLPHEDSIDLKKLEKLGSPPTIAVLRGKNNS